MRHHRSNEGMKEEGWKGRGGVRDEGKGNGIMAKEIVEGSGAEGWRRGGNACLIYVSTSEARKEGRER